MRTWFAGLAMLGLLAANGTAEAVGESVSGFPSYLERVMHQLINRARADPQVALQSCALTTCPEKACYTPVSPVYYRRELNRSARFHGAEMSKQGFFGHECQCTLVSNIAALYPAQCDGSASCACVGGVKACQPTCTSRQARVALFGTPYKNEIIAGGSGDGALSLFLFEKSTSAACSMNDLNPHRWIVFKSGSAVGVGSEGGTTTCDFGASGGEQHKIASGIHLSTTEVWASWYDSSAPKAAQINVGGTCTSLTLGRGAAANGAYTAKLAPTTSCPRYYFVFQDAAGAVVTYPSTGSLGLGTGACAEWSPARPALGAGCVGGGTAGGKDGGGSTAGKEAGASKQDAGGSKTADLDRRDHASAGSARDGGAIASRDAAGRAEAGARGEAGGWAVVGFSDASSSAAAGDGGGCSCSAAEGGDSGWVVFGLALVVALARRRRSPEPRSRGSRRS